MMSNESIFKGIVAFKCAWCGREFDRASSCAQHIESQSLTGFAFPVDIKIVIKDRARPRQGRRD